MPLSLDVEFCSFHDLQLVTEVWEKENATNLYTRCSRTLESAKKRAPKKAFNPALKYFSIDLASVHGGRKHKLIQSMDPGLSNRKYAYLVVQ